MQHHEESPEKSQYNMAILGERERERERVTIKSKVLKKRKDSIKFCLKKVLEK